MSLNAQTMNELVIPRTTQYDTQDNHYPTELLAFLLNKVDYAFEFKVSKSIYSQARVVESLKGGKLDVFWMGTSKKFEEELHAIPFPIYRGLTGHRLFLIHKDNQINFNEVKGLADLQSLVGVQGIGWSDIEILEYSGLKQDQGLYDNLFEMLHLKRADYFSPKCSRNFF
jgi:hypothetical protein